MRVLESVHAFPYAHAHPCTHAHLHTCTHGDRQGAHGEKHKHVDCMLQLAQTGRHPRTASTDHNGQCTCHTLRRLRRHRTCTTPSTVLLLRSWAVSWRTVASMAARLLTSALNAASAWALGPPTAACRYAVHRCSRSASLCGTDSWLTGARLVNPWLARLPAVPQRSIIIMKQIKRAGQSGCSPGHAAAPPASRLDGRTKLAGQGRCFAARMPYMVEQKGRSWVVHLQLHYASVP